MRLEIVHTVLMGKAPVSSRIRPLRGVAGLALCAVATALVATAATPRFYDDDPIWLDDDTVENASAVAPWKVQDVYDAYENTIGDPGAGNEGSPALNANTVGEVPDSSWFTNRSGARPLTAVDAERAGALSDGPAAGRWVVSEGKSDGVSPGFTVTDAAGVRWILKFDADEHPGMASGSEAITSRLFWALGYNVPEYHVVMVRADQLVVGEGARVQPPGAYDRDMRPGDVETLLRDAARNPDGSYRAVASRALPGKVLGPFRFYGTRPDDPNDVVPHEDRRELRGLRVFSAWLNHTEARSSNTLDTLVTENGRTFVRHHLLDFGATLGSGTLEPRNYWEGYDYLVDFDQALKGMASLGFYVLPWRRVPFHESPTVGRVPSDPGMWDPRAWRPRFANPAFRRARADDTFWAARKVAAMSGEIIRGAVRAGRLPDAESEALLLRTLEGRRDAIGRTYLAAVNPVIDAALDESGVLTFGNAAVDAGYAQPPARYRAAWHVFDNATGEVRSIGETSATEPRIAAPPGVPASPGTFLRTDVSAESPAQATWSEPVHAYFRRIGTSWKLVGLDRVR